LLKDVLIADLILTKTITIKEKDLFKKRMKIFFNTDSYIVERQEAETMMNRINNLNQIEPFIGKIISLETTLKSVMRMTDVQIDEERKRIVEEQKNGLYGSNTSINPVTRDDPQGEEGF
jgi:Icc-related predicted phosphoesterase